MPESISKEELSYIEDAAIEGIDEYHKRLEEHTGIKARPYTGYSYYDAAGNYIGDSSNSSTLDLLDAAYIRVEG